MVERGQPMETNAKDLAELARLGLRFGVVSPAAIIAWADGLIAAGAIPEPWLIDLALATQPDGIEDALRRVPGEAQADLSTRLLLTLVLRRWRAGRIDIDVVRGVGWWLHCEEALAAPDGQADWGVCLEVEGEEFDEGWRTEDDLRRSINEALAEYAWLEAQLPSWV